MASGSASPQSLNLACQRCRKRKVKCDLRAPSCGNCIKADVECVSTVQSSSRAANSLPPGYLECLESEVSRLEQEVRMMSGSNIATKSNSHDLAARLNNDTWSIDGGQNVPGTSPETRSDAPIPFDWSTIGEAGASSLHPHLAYGMNRMVKSAVAVDNRYPYHSSHSNPLFPLIRNPGGSCIRHPKMAEYLDEYFSKIHPVFPIIREDDIRQTFVRMSTSPGDREAALVLITLALGATISSDSDQISTYHRLELFSIAIEKSYVVASTDNVQTLQFILLVALFSLFNPAGGSTWHLLGLSSQVAVTLGLHQRNLSTRLSDPPLGKNLFWTLYIFDRLVAMALERPFSIDDLDISIELPEDTGQTQNLRYLSEIAIGISRMRLKSCSSATNFLTIKETAEQCLGSRSGLGGFNFLSSITLQLFTWVFKPSDLNKSIISDSGHPSGVMEALERILTYFDGCNHEHSPLPWTAAYTSLHAFCLWSYARRLAKVQEQQFSSGQSTAAQHGFSSDSAYLLIQICSQTFHGLKGLAPLVKVLIDSEKSQMQIAPTGRLQDAMQTLKSVDVESIPNLSTREAIRLLLTSI